MNNYNINFLKCSDYSALVILCNSDSPLQYLEDIATDLRDNLIEGNILIDQILHSGNNEERFIECKFDQGMFTRNSFKFVRIPKDSEFRKKTCNFLSETSLIEYSILSSIQKKMINKGISI